MHNVHADGYDGEEALTLYALAKESGPTVGRILANSHGRLAQSLKKDLRNNCVVGHETLVTAVRQVSSLFTGAAFEQVRMTDAVRNTCDFTCMVLKSHGADHHFAEWVAQILLKDWTAPEVTRRQKQAARALLTAGVGRFAKQQTDVVGKKKKWVSIVVGVLTSPLGGIPGAGPFAAQGLAVLTGVALDALIKDHNLPEQIKQVVAPQNAMEAFQNSVATAAQINDAFRDDHLMASILALADVK